MSTPQPRWLLLFDGVCGLCHGLVQFIIRRDRAGVLHFAPLQGPTAAAVLARHGRSAVDLDTVYLIENLNTPHEVLRDRAQAVLTALRLLGFPWTVLATLRLLPNFILNLGYRTVAGVRYRLFGKHETCPIPTPEQRSRFLD